MHVLESSMLRVGVKTLHNTLQLTIRVSFLFIEISVAKYMHTPSPLQ